MAAEQSRAETRSPCPNCGGEGLGRWCQVCGQDNRRARLDTRAIVHGAFEALTDLDSRLFTTLRGLTVRPGGFCREYVEGRRADRIPPFRYMLLMYALAFVFAGLMTPPVVQDSTVEKVRDLNAFIQRYLALLSIPTVFVAAWAYWRLFGRAALNYAENAAFALYTMGHAALISLLVLPVRLISYEAYAATAVVAGVAYYVWAARAFYRAALLGTIWRVAVVFIAFQVSVVFIAAAFAALYAVVRVLTDAG